MKKFLHKLFYFGVKPNMPIETSRKLILTNQLAYLTFILLLAINTVFTILSDQLKWEMLLSVFAILSILTIPFFNSRGQYKMTAFLLSILTPLFTLFLSIVSQLPTKEIYLTDFLFPRLLLIGQLVLPLILIDSKNKFQLIIAVIINLFCIIGFDLISGFFGNSFDPTRAIVENFKQINYVILFPSLLIIFGFYFLHSINRKYESAILKLNQELNHKNSELIHSNHEIEAQRDRIFEQNKVLHDKNEEIEARNEEISEKNILLEQAKGEIEFIHKNLTDSVMYAEKIQKVILGADCLPNGYFKEDFIFFKPKSIVSGDFYFYKPHIIKGKPCIIVTAADCTGHGVPGGFLSMMSISLLNEVIQKSEIQNAADILNLLREGIKKSMKQTGKETEQKDGLDIALCIYWPKEKRLDFSGARNPLFIVDNEKNETFIKGERQPIGIHLKEFPFTNHSINLKGNEMIYLFSDGFADQFGGIGKKLLLKFFKQNLVDIADKPCIQQKDAMYSLMNSWMKKDDGTQFEQTDDMVLVGFRIP